jgi:glycosyltransferase involved in cell wall biosynthesis
MATILHRQNLKAFYVATKTDGLATATGRAARYFGKFVGDLLDPGYAQFTSGFTRFHVDEQKIARIKAANAAFFSGPKPVKTAVWVMPDFHHITNGGPNTIIRFAHAMSRRGIKVDLIIADGNHYRDPEAILSDIVDQFGKTENLKVSYLTPNRTGELANLPAYDMAFATLWTTAYYVAQHIEAASYFYFIQDLESQFYPAGTEYGLADLTYEFGYFGVFNTPGLMAAVQAQHRIEGVAFSPGFDRDVYYPADHPVRIDEYPIRIVFYGRPGVPRNMFELGIDCLRQIKQSFADKVEILVVGSARPPVRLDFETRWLGYLPYRETGELYRSAHIGLALMATPHPSYLPIQLMACGVVPLALASPYTSWLLRDRVNSICAGPTPIGMAEKFFHAIADAECFDQMRRNAIATVQPYSWDRAIDQSVFRFIEPNPAADLTGDRAPAA